MVFVLKSSFTVLINSNDFDVINLTCIYQPRQKMALIHKYQLLPYTLL